MEENPELEEGEAVLQYNDDDDNMDPEIALSYIDEKIQKFLGHFKKEFEGRISQENLGAKYGDYGSFLPAYERSPQRNNGWSHLKTPQRNSMASRSPNNLPLEGASQSLKVSCKINPSVKVGSASCSAITLHEAGVASMDVSVRQDSNSAALVSWKSKKKARNSKKSGNLSDQRTLKVRLKVPPDSVVRKNAAIYSGLGLDNSPSSSSLGNSPGESDGMLPLSPASILQMMTSFPIPGDVPISPLHDSLFYLMRNDMHARDARTVPLTNGSQDNFVPVADESVSFMGHGKLLKGKAAKSAVKSKRAVELEHGNDTFKISTSFSAKNNIQKDIPEIKDVFSNNFQHMPPLGPANDFETLKATGRSSEVPRASDLDRETTGLFSSDLWQEDSSESRSHQGNCTSEKRNGRSRSVEKVSKHRALTGGNDSSVDLRVNTASKSRKTSVPPKGHSEVSKFKEDPKAGAQTPPKQRISHQAAFNVQDEIPVPCFKEKQLLEGKKSHGNGNSKREAAVTKERSGIGVSLATNDMMGVAHGVSKSKDKAQKQNFQKDTSRSRDNTRDHLDPKLGRNCQIVFPERPPGSWQKESAIGNLEHYSSIDRSSEELSGKRVGRQLIPEPSATDVVYVDPSISANGLSTQVIPPSMDHVVVEKEDWVCCDSCQKWRLLPCGTKPDQLPEKWVCRMLNWLPGMNRCDISEEETTNAVRAMSAVGQNNVQNHANGTTSGVHAQPFDHNYLSLDSNAVSLQGKKKRGLKDIAKSGTNSGNIQIPDSAKSHLLDSVKSRSLNGMNQSPAEVNLLNKSSFHPSRSHDLAAEQEEGQIAGADATKQLKIKNKREGDHHRYGASKKNKTKDVSHADKHSNSNMDYQRMGLNSKSYLSNKSGSKDLLNSNEHSLLEDDTKERLLVSVKDLGDISQVSPYVGCLDVKANDKMNISMKKRKLKEWQENQKVLNYSSNAEEIGDRELIKEKTPRVSKRGASFMNNNDDKLSKKEKMAHITSSGSQDHMIDDMKTVRSVNEDHRPRKHRIKLKSEQIVGCIDSLRKDLGPGQLSLTATSSSSKVSGSLKTRATVDDLKGSPVESVSSSPMRTSFSEKLGSSRGTMLGKDDASNGSLLMMDEHRRHWHGEGDGQINQSRLAKEKVSSGPHTVCHKNFPSDHQDGVANHKIGQPKCSDVLNSGAEIRENHQFSSDMLSTKNCLDEDKAERKHNENVLFMQKSGGGSSSQLKDNDRNSASDFDRGESRFSEPVTERGEFLKKSLRCDSEIDPRSHIPPKRMNNAKHSIPEKVSSKSSRDVKILVSSMGKCSKDSRTGNPSKIQGCDDSDAKLSSTRSRKSNDAPQETLIQDFDSEMKRNMIQRESRSGIPDLIAHAEREAKHDSQNHQSVRGAQQVDASIGLRIHTSSNMDLSKASRHPGNPGNKSGTHQSLTHRMRDMGDSRDLNAPCPGVTISSPQSASNALKEAKRLRDYADFLKVSGFDFESNEINFQAGQKFLHGASLLESSNEVGKQVEVTQIQVYSTAAKICECCALEYERRLEMAAAALAYKCMEVAYWRVVYCKNYSLSRDRNELQACLQTLSQGESPSSSASDIDNLNNQTTVDKATLSKSVSHVAGNPVVVTRNQPNFLRLLDFTQNVDFAVEASRKSHNAYSAANAALGVAQNGDCIVSVKKVLDFSFQDVEELIHLVQHAMEAITRAGLVGARD